MKHHRDPRCAKPTPIRDNLRVHEEDMVGNGEVERHASRLEADEEHLHSGVGLKSLKDLTEKQDSERHCHA